MKSKKRHNKLKASQKRSQSRNRDATDKTQDSTPSVVEPSTGLWRLKLIAATLLAVTFLWAYWPTFLRLVDVWNREPDYSHGFLVLPLALFFLYARRDDFPGLSPSIGWFGLLLIAASVGIRFVGTLVFVDAIDGWSVILWLAGAAWMLGGYRVAMWAAPSLAFLFFLVPLPFRAEGALSYPLQRIATKLSCFTFQFLGQPALAEGNTILLGDHQLQVEEACSGMRIFLGIIALAFASIILIRRSWWERALIMASALPVALIANATRIVATGFLHQYASDEAASKFSHDLSGWVMIPFAAALFWLCAWYLQKLFPAVEQVNLQDAIHRQVSETVTTV